jgi:outer membrane protein OmpA-like peptidoglycan-associated protein
MLVSENVVGATEGHSTLLRVFHLKRDKGQSANKGRLWAALGSATWIFAGAILTVTASGCLATRNWVNDQLTPINNKLSNTDAKADQALNGLQNLHLEKKLVLNSQHGPTFAFGSANLSPNAKREIDGFIEDLQGSTSTNPTAAASRVFVVAGHTDSVGSEDYNYELGQRRAEKVAGYLVGREGVDPTQVRVVSYGATQPIADNSTPSGRRSNRSVEILVYQEKITSGG